MNKQTRGLPRAIYPEYFRGKSRGFTLIELMVVVFIIALLASVVIVNVSSVRQKGRDAKRVSDLSTVAAALQSYYADNHQYVPAAGWLDFSAAVPGGLSVLVSGKYLSSLPTDPKNPTQNYSYYSVAASCSSNTSYVLRTYLESAKNNPADPTKTLTTFTLRNGESSTVETCL